jgi:4-diphosphocytidyl-2-C-methyl-D-erythritol kinase
MLFFPNCKINLGLNILRKRPDGYHDLETVFYPLPLKDALELIPTGDTEPAFHSYGLPIPGDPAGNLCLKAWRLTNKNFPDLPAIHIHLYKNIPIGAGLGGGSADGAGTLMGLNQLFHLNLSNEQLLGYAAQLGSDCPFFVLNTPCLGQGRGERLQPLPLDLSGYSFALVDPGIHISTAQAFALCTPRETNSSLRDIVSRPIETWTGSLINDFEAPLPARSTPPSPAAAPVFLASSKNIRPPLHLPFTKAIIIVSCPRPCTRFEPYPSLAAIWTCWITTADDIAPSPRA